MMTIIGIDPGLGGAIAILNDAVTVHPTPVIVERLEKSIRRHHDEPAMRDLLCGLDDPVAYVEEVHSMGGQGVRSMFTFGTGYGLWRGLLVGLGIPYTLVPPRTWQRLMFSGTPRTDPKAASLLVVKRLFPAASLRRTEAARTDDHGMADALLIAEYGRRTLAAGGSA